MTTPSAPGSPDDGSAGNPGEPVNLGKSGEPRAEAPFDPYRFGKPDHPVPPEFAPPGYGGGYSPVPEPSPYAAQQPPPYPGYPPPYQYGAPPPPPYHGYAQPRAGNGKAIAALVFGILSIFFFWLSLLDIVFVILALVFGVLGLSESRRHGSGRSMAIAGLVCMGVGAAAAMLWTAALVHAVNQCGGFDNADTGNSAFEQCVSDHLPWS
jgi:hypothetical protein